MILIPAIDIRAGKVVRLISGDFNRSQVYGDDPVQFAQEFERQGAKWLHVVDLDGALEGRACNLDQLKRIRNHTKAHIEFGGGLRTLEGIEEVLSLGVARVILGTKALDSDFVVSVLSKYGEKIAVSLDAKEGKVQVQGWTQESPMSPSEVLEKLQKLGLRFLIYTNIARDGTMQGPDISGLEGILESAGNIQVILSGGISSLKDLARISSIPHNSFYGVIVGRALYERKFSVADALEVVRMQSR